MTKCNLGTRIIEGRSQKNTLRIRVYQTVFVAYFAQPVCENPVLWVHMETRKAKNFIGKTTSKILEKVKRSFCLNILVIKQFTPDSGS
jgi:hypothetical protein